MAGQRFYWLHNTFGDDSQQVGQMCFDENGNLYIATTMGVQICDQNGRVRAILSLPDSAPIHITYSPKSFLRRKAHDTLQGKLP